MIIDLIGYIKYPSKDNKGFYYEYDYKGIDGVEEFFDDVEFGWHKWWWS